jgi:hypothetical protein
MPKIFDVVAITGKYTAKDGTEKASYANVGMIIEKDGKQYLKMKHPVTVDDAGAVVSFFSLYVPKEKEQRQGSGGPKPVTDFSDEIPF